MRERGWTLSPQAGGLQCCGSYSDDADVEGTGPSAAARNGGARASVFGRGEAGQVLGGVYPNNVAWI